jgi:hypothetical protein
MKQFAVEKSTDPVPEFVALAGNALAQISGAIAGAIVAITVNHTRMSGPGASQPLGLQKSSPSGRVR